MVGVSGRYFRGRTKLFGKEISKGDLLEMLAKNADIKTIIMYSDKRWKYPTQGDDQKTCKMLDMNIAVEQKAGIVIHIPNKVIEDMR